MQNTQKQQLLHLYKQLPPKISIPVHYSGGNIRNKDNNGQLQKVFMAFAAYVAVNATKYKRPFVLLVTASHNPPDTNGIKLQSLGKIEPIDVGHLERVINNQKEFEVFVNGIKEGNKPSNIPTNFFVGRDCRPTSQGLSSIIIRTLTIMGNTVIDLGQTTTPEALSLSQYITDQQSTQPQKEIKQLTNNYYCDIGSFWKKAINMIEEHKGRQWKKKSIYIDCSNGVSSISIQKYDFFDQYFDMKITHNEDFSQPNVNCGAEWIYNHRLKLDTIPPLPQAEHYVWFDGDADRIIMKLHNDKGLTQGEDFIVCFVNLIQKLLVAFPNDLKLGYVGNIVANSGLAKHMKKQNIQGQLSSVGIVNLFNSAKNYDIGVFFESNGHGCIYFSQQTLKVLNQAKQQYWQAELLLLIHSLCRNNCRGYALHDFLAMQLYLFFTGNQMTLHFRKQFNLDKNYEITHPQIFANRKQGTKTLKSPQNLVLQLNNIAQKHQDLTILVRKATTGPILRLTIQGEQTECQEILPLLEQIILNYTQ